MGFVVKFGDHEEVRDDSNDSFNVRFRPEWFYDSGYQVEVYKEYLKGFRCNGLIDYVKFNDCVLSDAVFDCVSMYGCEFKRSNLSGASFVQSGFRSTTFFACDFVGTDFKGLRFFDVGFQHCNLSGAKGLLDPSDWLFSNFASTPEGLIVYKAIGATHYGMPDHWEDRPGAILTEVCNPNRTEDCGCGVNFATEEWCRSCYSQAEIWECLIAWKDLAGVVVPYMTDGKARCSRLTLLRKIT